MERASSSAWLRVTRVPPLMCMGMTTDPEAAWLMGEKSKALGYESGTVWM